MVALRVVCLTKRFEVMIQLSAKSDELHTVRPYQKAPDGAEDEDAVSENVSGRVGSGLAPTCGSSLTYPCSRVSLGADGTLKSLPNYSNKYTVYFSRRTQLELGSYYLQCYCLEP